MSSNDIKQQESDKIVQMYHGMILFHYCRTGGLNLCSKNKHPNNVNYVVASFL